MAVLDYHRASAHVGTSIISRAIKNAVAYVLSWNDARQTEKVLSQLSDHELDDIGLSRGTISSFTHR